MEATLGLLDLTGSAFDDFARLIVPIEVQGIQTIVACHLLELGFTAEALHRASHNVFAVGPEVKTLWTICVRALDQLELL